MKVNWKICERIYLLLSSSHMNNRYIYCHLIHGQSYPLCSLKQTLPYWEIILVILVKIFSSFGSNIQSSITAVEKAVKRAVLADSFAIILSSSS